MIGPADIEAARVRVAGVLRPTPVDRSDSLSRITGRPVLLKPEHLQRTGSFKIRGAYNFLAALDPAVTDVVAGSAAGQGTIGLEIADEAPEASTVVVPIGGGGLISGIAAALAAVRPGTRVVGVEAAGAPTMRAALDAGRCVRVPSLSTMADGIAVQSASDLTLRHVQAFVDEVVTVSEEEISAAVLLLLERAKAVVEPAGAVALAAILNGSAGGDGPVVAVLSGGNVDPQLLIKLIDHGLSASGRYLLLRIVIPDHPGALAALTTEVARLGLNVLDVEHHRAGIDLALDEVEVLLTVQTSNTAHRDEVAAALVTAGYRVDQVR